MEIESSAISAASRSNDLLRKRQKKTSSVMAGLTGKPHSNGFAQTVSRKSLSVERILGQRSSMSATSLIVFTHLSMKTKWP